MDDGQIKKHVAQLYELVEKNGLEEGVFNDLKLPDIECVVWLVSRGSPVSKIVALLNARQLAELRKLRRTLEKAELSREDSIDKLLQSAEFADSRMKANPMAFMAELHAFLLSSDNEQQVTAVVAEMLMLHASLRRGNFPDAKRLAVERLQDHEIESVRADAEETVIYTKTDE